MLPPWPNSSARSMASSMASLVPEPIEKWAVWAASPISTTGTVLPPMSMRCVQCLQITRGKRIQLAEPRRCDALLMSECPPRYLANSFSQKAMASGCSIWSRPCAFQTSSGVSTMKVEVVSSNW